MKTRTASPDGSNPDPFSCSIHGPGVDIEILLGEGQTIRDLFRSIADTVVHGGQVFRQGYAVGQTIGQAHGPESAEHPSDDKMRASDPNLRLAVTSDLREMWNAMWPTGPAQIEPSGRDERDARDATFERWVASATGQRIIDESLGKFDAFPGEPAPAQGDQKN